MKVAAIQCALPAWGKPNIDKIAHFVEQAAALGAQVILPPELFAGPYFCFEERQEYFSYAAPVEKSLEVLTLQKIAKSMGCVIPASFFERDGHHYYNSCALIDTDGQILGVYRKSHIPDGPGYEEKFYFRPGNTGFKVWQTRFGNLGVGICWDQWFPECARAMMLRGADILFYPTAIGTEPDNPDLNTKDFWQRAMIGHAVSNIVPVVAANRTGLEAEQSFYGHSFIANHRGELIESFGESYEGVLVAEFDLEQIRLDRASFGFFRDRRPDLYGALVQE